MWMLAKDHLKLNRVRLALMSIALAMLAISFWREHHNHYLRESLSTLLLCTVILRYGNPLARTYESQRIWRTLPCTENSLATVAWGMAIAAVPIPSFLILLSAALLASLLGATGIQTVLLPFLFLLLATLMSGLAALDVALSHRSLAGASAAQPLRHTRPLSAAYPTGFRLLILCTALLLIVPTPHQWTDLAPSHLAGLCLSAWMTWKSFLRRVWLLQPEFVTDDDPDDLAGRETAPEYHHAPRSMLLHELGAIMKETLVAALLCIAICYGALYWATHSALRTHAFVIQYASTTAAVICVGTAAILVATQSGSLTLLCVIRNLPLTARRCTLLLLSFPWAAALAVVPCTAVPLWLTGHGQLPWLLLAGFLFAGGLCPFAMYLNVLFGKRTAPWIIGAGIVAATFADLRILQGPTSLPPGVLWAGAIVLAILGLVGYDGLRTAVENYSFVYKQAGR
jgi:hypothetical protein